MRLSYWSSDVCSSALLRALLHGDQLQPHVLGHAPDVALQIDTAHHVQNDVHAPPAGDLQHPLDKILAVVVDRMGSADVERRRTFLVRSAGHADRKSTRLNSSH